MVGGGAHSSFVLLSILLLQLILLDPSRGQSSSLSGHTKIVQIGALFDDVEPYEKSAFKNAVQRINDDPNLLPRSRIEAQIEHLQAANSVSASSQVCNMMSKGVAAIFGPQTHESASHVQSICDAFEIPHIETKWDFRIRKENYMINLYPHPFTLSRAYNDLVEAFGWESYIVIYDAMYRQRTHCTQEVTSKSLCLLYLYARPLFREILRETKIRNIVLDCDTRKILGVLKQAQQIGLMTYKYSYVLTTLDLHTIDLEDFRFAEVNITAFRMVDPNRPEVQTVLQQYQQQHSETNRNSFTGNYGSSLWMTSNGKAPENNHVQLLKTDTALLYDAVYLLAKALHVLDSSQRIEIKRLNCSATDTWPHGYSIINYMKMVQLQGLTGLIQFNTTGFRTDVNLDVIQLKDPELKDPEGLKKIGAWDSKFASKFNWSRPVSTVSKDELDALSIRNRTFRVSTMLNAPFTMLTRSEKPLLGNARYEGFVVDLLQKLSVNLGFKYIIKPVSDGGYGQRNQTTGEWNGMISEVLRGEADIAVADLTISKDRQEAVDFTMPFMNLGISILYVVPTAKPPSLFSFLSPFSKDVWLYMFIAFFGVSVILYILARLTPYEWCNPHPCITEPDELVNQFTSLNSFWFTIGSLMQQGSDVAPKAVSTRMIAGIWWFFTLIMVSSYTANLATFLIVQDLDETIKNLEDLAKQDKVKYGCVGTGSTVSFFRDSPFKLNKQIWDNIVKANAKQMVLMKDNKHGIEKVKASNGNYAFFMESTVIEYTIERECKLAQVGGLLDSKGYGIALPKGSKYLQFFSSGILNLQEAGALDELKRKWWKEERKESNCALGSDGDAVKPLRLANVGGVFVVLVCGSLFAVLLALLEFVWKSKQAAKIQGDSFWNEFTTEFKFALACRGNTKPVKKKENLSGNTDLANNGSHGIGSNPYLDLPVDSYGFPKVATPMNGRLDREGFT
ncbi:unnamed protein product [Allacma fusca]|uniref:Glutamate receptor ionotropic, kainate 2 n=1 Tax=Allacma fusca TaxID=39272 RepID=A0A8J2LPR5_9HEXA|nr:unnamed protein product [Allacma fusca]